MFVQGPKPFERFAATAEQFLAERYPNIIESGGINRISIGRNSDSQIGVESGYKVAGDHARHNAVYLDIPPRMIDPAFLADKRAAVPTVRMEMPKEVASHVADSIHSLQQKGLSYADAMQRAQEGVQYYCYLDRDTAGYVVTPVVRRVNDSILSGLNVPYWNVSYFTKVFKQPFVQTFARNLVSVVGVPNAWADVITLFTEAFEGAARVSTTARGTVEPNYSSPVRNRMNQIVSEIVNIVVDYEHGVQEVESGKQVGNFLNGIAMSDRETYSRMMMEQLYNALILFGNPESGFEGISTIAGETAYSGTPLEAIWNSTVITTKGSDVVEAFNTLLGNAQERINFLPTSVRINVSTTVFKVLNYSMYSKQFNPESPLVTLDENFKGGVKIQGPTKGVDYFLVPDPMCNANTPWNRNPSDLMFITFPTVRSALEDQSDLIMAPVALESYILPALYQRNGLLYTMIKRVGSIIAPIEDTMLVLRGFGKQ
jgi:hypothetical protein